jgi:hypothetical protein
MKNPEFQPQNPKFELKLNSNLNYIKNNYPDKFETIKAVLTSEEIIYLGNCNEEIINLCLEALDEKTNAERLNEIYDTSIHNIVGKLMATNPNIDSDNDLTGKLAWKYFDIYLLHNPIIILYQFDNPNFVFDIFLKISKLDNSLRNYMNLRDLKTNIQGKSWLKILEKIENYKNDVYLSSIIENLLDHKNTTPEVLDEFVRSNLNNLSNAYLYEIAKNINTNPETLNTLLTLPRLNFETIIKEIKKEVSTKNSTNQSKPKFTPRCTPINIYKEIALNINLPTSYLDKVFKEAISICQQNPQANGENEIFENQFEILKRLAEKEFTPVYILEEIYNYQIPKDYFYLNKFGYPNDWELDIALAHNPSTPVYILEKLAKIYKSELDAHHNFYTVFLRNPSTPNHIIYEIFNINANKDIRDLSYLRDFLNRPSLPADLIAKIYNSYYKTLKNDSYELFDLVSHPKTPDFILLNILKSNDDNLIDAIFKRSNLSAIVLQFILANKLKSPEEVLNRIKVKLPNNTLIRFPNQTNTKI